MASLSLDQAVRIIDVALAMGESQRWAPLCVAVLDAGGHVLALKRSERASSARPAIAVAKASGCLGMGFGGRELMRRAQAHPGFYSAIAQLFPQGIVPVPGGVLIQSADGSVLGAVGISGDTSEHDEACAVAGIKAVDLVADTGDAT